MKAGILKGSGHCVAGSDEFRHFLTLAQTWYAKHEQKGLLTKYCREHMVFQQCRARAGFSAL